MALGRRARLWCRSRRTEPTTRIRALGQRSAAHQSRWALSAMAGSLEEVLIDLLDMKRLFNPAPDIVPYHKLCQLLSVDQYDPLAEKLGCFSRAGREDRGRHKIDPCSPCGGRGYQRSRGLHRTQCYCRLFNAWLEHKRDQAPERPGRSPRQRYHRRYGRAPDLRRLPSRRNPY